MTVAQPQVGPRHLPDAPIAEEAVQDALALILRSDKNVQDRFLSAIGYGQYFGSVGGRLHDITMPNLEPEGETDVLGAWTSSSGERLHLLIEVKLTAGFMARQGERYIARAKRAVAENRCDIAKTALVAPASYLESPNPEARFFDHQIPIEEVITWSAESSADEVLRARALMLDALERIATDRPLGAKGLYPDLYLAVAEECARRQNEIRITNKPTDWMMLAHPTLPPGVHLQYRIRQRQPEIRVLSSFRGDRQIMLESTGSMLEAVRRGGEIFIRPVTHLTDPPTDESASMDVRSIVDALEFLLAWACEQLARPARDLLRERPAS